MKLLRAAIPVLMFFFGAGGIVNFVNAEREIVMNNRCVDSECVADTKLKSRINDVFSSQQKDYSKSVELIVHEGRVLAVGYVASKSEHDAIVKIIEEMDGCVEFIDEIKIQEKPKVTDNVADTARTAEMKALLFVPNNGVSAMNYKVLTVKGVVYVLGISESENERQKVVEIAQKSSKKGEVVTHIIVRK